MTPEERSARAKKAAMAAAKKRTAERLAKGGRQPDNSEDIIHPQWVPRFSESN
jgi:hypothetical protein